MIITSDIFEAYLKCPSKCWFRIKGKETAGNIYSQWVEKKNRLYRERFYRFLDFLRSGVKDIRAFAESKRRRRGDKVSLPMNSE